VLQGSLREIKKQFPRERVIVRLEDDRAIEGLETIAGVRSAAKLESGYEVLIDRPDAAQAILDHARQQGDVVRFELMEPTLNEIFIRSVGENIE